MQRKQFVPKEYSAEERRKWHRKVCVMLEAARTAQAMTAEKEGY